MELFKATIELIGQVSLMIVVSYIFSRTWFFKQIVNQDFTAANRILLIVVFGLFSIYGTYAGIHLTSGANVDIHILGPLAAGLLGGPFCGLGAGLIGGLHSLYLDGFGAVPTAIATVIIGLTAGIIYNVLRGRPMTVLGSILFAAIAVCFLMGLTLWLGKPADQALTVVKESVIPMIVADALASGLMVTAIRNVIRIQTADASEYRNP